MIVWRGVLGGNLAPWCFEDLHFDSFENKKRFSIDDAASKK